MSGRLVERFLPVAVLEKDGLASRVNRNDANKAILRVGDIKVICGSTFSKFFSSAGRRTCWASFGGKDVWQKPSTPGNNGVVFCQVKRLSRRFCTPTASGHFACRGE